MYKNQRGITLIGWLFLLVPLAVCAYAGIRVAPIYLNYMKVSRALEQVAQEYEAQESVSMMLIRNSLEKRLDIESVTYPTAKDVGVRRDGKGWVLEAKYEDVAPLFSNVSLLLAFDKSVPIE
jgi:hypothetical protein